MGSKVELQINNFSIISASRSKFGHYGLSDHRITGSPDHPISHYSITRSQIPLCYTEQVFFKKRLPFVAFPTAKGA